MSKRKTSVSHKCPNCRANLTFNPKDQNWVCEYCDSKFKLEDLKKNEQKYEEKKVDKEELVRKHLEDTYDLVGQLNYKELGIKYTNTREIYEDRQRD